MFFYLVVVLIVHPHSAYRCRDVCRLRYQIQVLVFESRALTLDVVEARITEGFNNTKVRTKL